MEYAELGMNMLDCGIGVMECMDMLFVFYRSSHCIPYTGLGLHEHHDRRPLFAFPVQRLYDDHPSAHLDRTFTVSSSPCAVTQAGERKQLLMHLREALLHRRS